MGKEDELNLFIKKSEQNERIGDLALSNKSYNACINRYYYSLYQLVLYCIYYHEKDFDEYKELERRKEIDKKFKGGVHVSTITKYIELAEKEGLADLTDLADLWHMMDLCKWRKKADYTTYYFDKNKYESLVIGDYEDAKRGIQKIKKIVESDGVGR